MTGTLSFSIETASDALDDVQICVVPSDDPPRPRWTRRRVLGNKEIVDELIDLNTGRVSWTVHRPVDGWYLRLRSPCLPAQAALSLTRPSKRLFKPEGNAKPLCMQIVTRPKSFPSEERRVGFQATHTRTVSNPFTSITLEPGETSSVPAAQEDEQQQQVRSTGVESNSGHARRRSSGVPATQHSSRRSVSNTARAPVIAEGEWQEEAAQEQAPGGPRPCTIILSDGQTDVDSATANASDAPGWSRWSWRAVPQFLKADLAIQPSNSFVIWWADAPSAAAHGSRHNVELARFIDEEASSWNWKSKRKGTLSFDKETLRALNVDLAMWIALSLAYLEFLNERKGFDAAYDA